MIASKTHQQLKNISRLLRELRIDQGNKEILLLQFTNGRSASRSDLSFEEARNLERYLMGFTQPKDDPADKMRKKIISRFHEMGYRKNGKIDMEHVEATVLKYGYLHKPLNQYSHTELPKLVSQVDKMLHDYLKAGR